MVQNICVISRDGVKVTLPVARPMNGIDLQRMFCRFTAQEIVRAVSGAFVSGLATPATVKRNQ